MDIFYISVIFVLSILMQLISVVLALRLIKTTGYFRVWLALAIAVTLMAIRRIISFYHLLYFHDVKVVNVTAELVALLISAFMVYGIYHIRPVLCSLFRAKDESDHLNQQLRKEIEQRKFAQREAKNIELRLHSLSEYQQNMIEKERSFIAREIHDELGQDLSGLHMGLSWIKSQLPKTHFKTLAKTRELIALTNVAVQKVKKLSGELHPRIIDDIGLAAAVEWYVREYEKNSHIHCELQINDEELTLDHQKVRKTNQHQPL